MPPSRQPRDPVQNLLEEAETELSRRLREACDAEARGVSTESAEEIRRLEDTLLSAAMAAHQAHAAQRHLQHKPPKAEARSSETVRAGGRAGLLDEAIDAPSRKARRPNLESSPEAEGLH